jgi:DNA-binding MurR/RpiR family transcriptional regulator
VVSRQHSASSVDQGRRVLLDGQRDALSTIPQNCVNRHSLSQFLHRLPATTHSQDLMKIRELLTHADVRLTPSEAKIVQILLDDYPIAGLESASSLARTAGVSDPTVIRLIAKLGFDGYSAFQAKLLEEVDASMRSPLMMMETKRPAAKGRSIAEVYMRSAAAAVEMSAGLVLPQVCVRAVSLIMGSKGSVIVLGGRFSRYVSGMFAAHLGQLRPDTIALAPLSPESFDLLVDFGPRDVLVVFDYRRYQTDVIRFAEQAAARDVAIVLFTDPWRSPIASMAKVVLVASGEVGSPYDSLAPAVAQMEALVAHIVAEGSRSRDTRVARIERVRTENSVTVEQVKPKYSRHRKGTYSPT